MGKISTLQKTLLLAFLLLTVGMGTWSAWQQNLRPLAQSAAPRRIHISPGLGSVAIGTLLEKEQLISSATVWRVYLNLHGWTNRLKAGTYDLSAQQSLPDIAQQLVEGRVVQVKFTIPEGWNLKQMAHYFATKSYFPETAFWSLVKGPGRLQVPWLARTLPQLEGFLYPDTYQLDIDQLNARAVVTQMLQRFQKVALPVYKTNTTPLSLVQWATLASIVEKEAVVAQERPVIAGVFWSRLKQKIPLGSDPTVEYAFDLTQTVDRRLTYKQVRQPSPYNTYVTAGLPPTPIASAGLASLKSAAMPQTTAYLYFVARYDGTHIFSRTAQEHEQAKNLIKNHRQGAQIPLR